MYITGTADTLEDRIHQLLIDSGDYTNYSAERTSYSSSSDYLKIRWKKEFIKKGYGSTELP